MIIYNSDYKKLMIMAQPLLSILIPSIPSRFARAVNLYEDIVAMVGDKDIEILMLTDNKKRTIGEKREALKNISNGKYFMFVDDDDSLYSVDAIYEACKNDVDVITFKSKCLNADGSTYIVTAGLGNEVEHNTADGRYLDCKRPPFPNCAWSEHFKPIPFPALNYAEDWGWVERTIRQAHQEIHIPEVLHGYNFNPEVSEAVAPVRRCVVNYATAQYYPGQMRLAKSVPGEDILLFNEKDGFPPHSENPYAFKIYSIEKAIEQGYDQVLFFDASVYAVKPLKPVWDWLESKGIFMEEAGHYLGSWCNDRTLAYFGIIREEAMTMPMFSAGFVGFDFRNPISREFFAEWKEAMNNGMFKGSWTDHRHDLSCASAIANLRGLVPLYSSGGQFFAYTGVGYSQPNETVVCNVQGM